MHKSIKYTVTAAIIAALYAALTIVFLPISFGPVQLRVSEALTILPIFTPAAIPGLTLGCLISNTFSSYGLIDIIFGSFATLLASFFAYYTRKIYFKNVPVLAPLGAVLFNAIIISGLIVYVTKTPNLYGINLLQIGAGQTLACYGLGLPLWYALKKSKLQDLIK